MHFLWVALKCVAMLFVVLLCLVLAARMNELGNDTGNYQYLMLTILVDTAFICWAYEVIWKPISRA